MRHYIDPKTCHEWGLWFTDAEIQDAFETIAAEQDFRVDDSMESDEEGV
jgi:hypothetical protein